MKTYHLYHPYGNKKQVGVVDFNTNDLYLESCWHTVKGLYAYTLDEAVALQRSVAIKYNLAILPFVSRYGERYNEVPF